MANGILIEVAVAVPVFGTFTYRLPHHRASAAVCGVRVLIPFRHRRITGYILGPTEAVGNMDVKDVIEVLDTHPLFPESMIPFFRWIADYYIHPLGEVIKNALPGGLTLSDRVDMAITPAGRSALESSGIETSVAEILRRIQHRPQALNALLRSSKTEQPGQLLRTMEANGWIERRERLAGGKTSHLEERVVVLVEDIEPGKRWSNARKEILRLLREESEIPVRRLKETIPTASSLVRSMERSGQVIIRRKKIYRDPFGNPIEPDTIPEPTPHQAAAIGDVAAAVGNGFRTFLLAGVTGSGKTEVYMQAAARALESGFSTLVLVPEIALTTQMERRFRARFGECIAVLHSNLSAGERFDQWTRITSGRAQIVIGARSAIFAPLDNLGLIVVDEEHDPSYKQEGGLRYNARDLAVVRAQQLKAVALLGSATPSIQSVFNVRSGKFHEILLPERVEQRPLPHIRIVDLSASRDRRGIRRFFSPELRQALEETLSNNEQALLFLNRRGYAGFPVCGTCNSPLRCRNCAISLTFHQSTDTYRCHYCGFSRPAGVHCPECSADDIRLFGLGTEKLEESVQRLFPDARVARMDRDTTRRKGAVVRLLRDLNDRRIDILVGTQMITKGHDFPNITLVGIVSADLTLGFPDFRSGERTFQLLAQVAGRAGRGDVPGRVFLQTYNPDHFCITSAKTQDARAFYREEIAHRKALRYPPFARLVQIRISGRNPSGVRRMAEDLGLRGRHLIGTRSDVYGGIELLGPIESPLSRLKNRHRWQLLLKGQKSGPLNRFTRELVFDRSAARERDATVTIDVDPLSMM